MLALLAIVPVLKTIDLLFGMAFIANKRTKTYLIITCAATFANTVAAVVLIPLFSYRGAVLASIASDITAVVLGNIILSRMLGGSPLSGAILRPGIAFLAGIACAVPAWNHPWVACILALSGFTIVSIILMRKSGWGLRNLKSFEAADDGDGGGVI